ncbi:MAG: alpha/beta fold hydrolase [Pseudaminobacter sp.]
MTNNKQLSFATANDGARIAYRTAGKGPARCVLIHSLAMDHRFWHRVVPLIENEAEILLIDCRGHGRSDKPAGPYSGELFAEDIAAVMVAVSWESAVVCGASMGGSISIAFAEAYPQMTSGLGLFDTTAFYGEDASKAWEERAMKARREGLAALAGFQKTRWFSDAFREANPDVVDEALGAFLANDMDAYVETCRMLGAFDKRLALGNFRMPCEIRVGEEDYATPVEMAKLLETSIPGSRMEVIGKARHLTPLEVPEIIADAIRSLIDRA